MIKNKKKKYTNINKIIFIILFLSGKAILGQTTISGTVKDSIGKTISLVNVLIKPINSESIVAYTYSDNNGKYQIFLDNYGDFVVSFSRLGYKSAKIDIANNKNQRIISNITLYHSNEVLDEVILNTSKPISIKKDTIIFDAKKFLTGNEQVVEDLLKNIPGLQIDDKGTIKINNQEIEKVMVEGDDFFERGYKILTKNMPTAPIKKVEIYNNYSNNKLLKDIEESDKVALNLVLKEDAKRVWFGNITAGYDFTFSNRYSLQSNLMNFGKKNKYYFLTNLNSIGYDATGDVNYLIRSNRYGEAGSIGDNQSSNSLVNFNAITPNFKTTRTNFNNAELASLNAIFTLSKKVKLKTLGFFNWDENDFFSNATEVFSTNGTNFTNTENYQLRKKKFVGFGKIDLTYDISKTEILEITTKYNNQNNNDLKNLIFNSNTTIENLTTNNTLFDQKLRFTNKFQKNKALIITGRYIDEKTPQNFTINQFFYEGLFSNSDNIDNVSQQNENKMQFVGVDVHLLDRKEKGNLLELKFGNEYRKDSLYSELLLKENNTVIQTSNEYSNATNYFSNDLYFNSKYRLKLNKVFLTGTLDFHQLFNKVQQNNNLSQQRFFLNPNVRFEWEPNSKNKINTSYTYSTSNAKVLDVYNNYVLTGFRSFSRGTGTFNQLDASSINLNYTLGNWSDNFFANTFFSYTKNHDFFSTNSIVTQNYTQSEKILIKDREMLYASTNLNRYIKAISSNLKLNLSYSKSNYKNIINNSNLREVVASNYNYGLELRSGFGGFFNYHIGTKWMTNEIETTINNSFTNNTSFLDLSFYFNTKLNVQIQTERYFFGNTGQEDNTYYFADLDARYTLKKNKITLSLSGKNLFNTKTFKTSYINDISSSTTEYRLLPRYLLIKMEYRF